MATLVLNDAKLWVAQYDLSGNMNQLALNYGAELQDATVFGNSTRARRGGLKTVALNGGGYWQGGTGEVDDVLFGKIGVADQVVSVSADGGDEGEIGYTFKAIKSQYAPGASLGEMFAFTIAGEGTGELVRGTIMVNDVLTVTGTSTARQLGAVLASQKLYASAHVLAKSGTTPALDLVVRSDDNAGMTTPTTRITFSQFTDVGSAWATPVEGAITDDHWDIEYTIGGTSPLFTVVVIVGIQ